MGKTVNFSVSAQHMKETVTLQKLGIDEDMSEIAIKKAVEVFLRDWVWNNVSFSYVIKEED